MSTLSSRVEAAFSSQLLSSCFCACVILVRVLSCVLQIRVVNAFRMGLEADSFDKRSLSSLHSQQSIQNWRLQQAMKRSASTNPGATPSTTVDLDGSVLRSNSYPPEGDAARV